MKLDRFKRGGSHDWRVGLFLIVGLVVSGWLEFMILRGDFGPDMQRGSQMFWGLR